MKSKTKCRKNGFLIVGSGFPQHGTAILPRVAFCAMLLAFAINGQEISDEFAPTNAPSLDLPTKATLRVLVVEGPDKTPSTRPMITVRPAGTMAGQPLTLPENPAEFVLPPGDYDVSARTEAENETAPYRATAIPGQTNELIVDITPGALELTITAGGNNARRLLPIQFRRDAHIMGVAGESPARFTAIAGIYQARLQFMGAQFFDIPNLEIKAGETNAYVVEVPCAQLTVLVSGGGYGESGKSLPYVELDRNGKMVTALTANPARFQILSGDYEIFVREDDKRLGYRQLSIGPGQEMEITLDISSAP